MDELAADLGMVVDEEHLASARAAGVGRGETRRTCADDKKIAGRLNCGLSAGGRLCGSIRPGSAMAQIAPSYISHRGHKKALY